MGCISIKTMLKSRIINKNSRDRTTICHGKRLPETWSYLHCVMVQFGSGTILKNKNTIMQTSKKELKRKPPKRSSLKLIGE